MEMQDFGGKMVAVSQNGSSAEALYHPFQISANLRQNPLGL